MRILNRAVLSSNSFLPPPPAPPPTRHFYQQLAYYEQAEMAHKERGVAATILRRHRLMS